MTSKKIKASYKKINVNYKNITYQNITQNNWIPFLPQNKTMTSHNSVWKVRWTKNTFYSMAKMGFYTRDLKCLPCFKDADASKSIQYFHKHTNLSLAVKSSEFLKFVIGCKNPVQISTNYTPLRGKQTNTDLNKGKMDMIQVKRKLAALSLLSIKWQTYWWCHHV